MKIRIIALSILAVATIFVIAQSLPISRFPNTATPNDSDLFVLAQTQAPATNKNIRYDQLRGAVRSGMATETFVLNTSNSLAANSFARLEQQTNGVRLGLVTNQNWVLGVTGYVSGATAVLGVDPSVLSSGAVLWTNSGGFVMLTTNGPVSIASTGLIDGLVVTQDIRFLGHNSASNSVWVCTNSATGEGEWRTVSSLTSSIGFNPETNILNIQYEPVRGSTWYAGTNGTPTTNQARAGLEFSPFWRSLRMGEVAAGADAFGFVGNGSNYWNNTNIGPCTVGFGSNAFVKGAFSSVLGGGYNHVMTGSLYCVIAGGSENYIRTNIDSSSILGGTRNRIDSDNFGMGVAGNSVIVGGTNNLIVGASRGSVLGGGQGNTLRGPNNVIVGGKDHSIEDTNGGFNFIGGGESHLLGGATAGLFTKYAVIAGGSNHQIDESSDNSVISGGADNLIGQGSTNSVIAGGRFNTVGALGNRKFGAILGGERNTVDSQWGFAIGTSNKVGPNGTFSGAIGAGVTNDANSTLVLGYGNLIGKVLVRAATNATVGGIVISTTTPVASAGAAETNLITRTIPAHTLTNDQDRLTFRFSGRFAATANAKQLKVVYGSETILDTTSQVNNGGAWTVEGEIIRTGDTAQSVNAEIHGLTNFLFTTSSSLNLAQTNGIATALKMTSTAAGDGDVTNRTATVWLWPAP